jgi:hypothetical protein
LADAAIISRHVRIALASSIELGEYPRFEGQQSQLFWGGSHVAASYACRQPSPPAAIPGRQPLFAQGGGLGAAANPAIVPFVATAVAQAMKWYDSENLSASRLTIGNAIRLMCRAAKSREGDHFAAAIGLRSLLEGFAPE